MAKKKTWTEKLNDSKDLPKVITIDEHSGCRWSPGRYLVPAPIDVDAVMRLIPHGRVMTIEELRRLLAKRYDTEFACPLTTGIFTWIAAQAAVEAEAAGVENVTPWWRTLKSKGELNPKFPGGPDRQRERLEAEGLKVVQRGKRFFVVDYEGYMGQ